MLFFLICAAFALFPEKVICGASEGIELCLNVVIPSLLPFMILSGCVIKSNFARPLGAVLSKIITPITGISSGGCVCFLTGLVGGYGAGARAVLESYRKNIISKKEAQRLLPFCNNAGPLFVIGTVGVGFYGSKSIGVMLFLVQIITAVITARIFSGQLEDSCNIKDEWVFYKKNKPSTGGLITEAVIESGSAIVTACSFIILFSAFLEVIPFGEYGIIKGITEVTRGVSEMSRSGERMLPMTSAFIAWGGMSVHLQADALCAHNFSLKTYYAGKIFSGLCAGAVTRFVCADINLLAVFSVCTIAVLLIWGVVKKAIFQEFFRLPLFRRQRHS